MTTVSDELLACPFCGGSPYISGVAANARQVAVCGGCGAMGSSFWRGGPQATDAQASEATRKAIAAWNTRADAAVRVPVEPTEARRMGKMVRIDDLIAELTEVSERFGNTCVYIKNMSWGAVALNRQHDDSEALAASPQPTAKEPEHG